MARPLRRRSPALLPALALFACCVFGAIPARSQVDAELMKPLGWRNIGPFRGGRVTTVAGVAQDAAVFYMGATGGGVWKTTDGGVTWRNVSDGHFHTGSVGAITVAPSDPNVVYVGMGEAPVRGVANSYGDGVYKSTDGGATWQHLGLTETRHISRIQVHPRDPDVVWVAAQGYAGKASEERGVYRSTDGGATWNRVLFVSAGAGACDLSLDVTNPRVLYAAFWQHRRLPWKVESGGTDGGIYKTTDGGDTWEELAGGLPESPGKIGVAVSPARPQRVWAMVEAEEGGLFRSDDGGKKWERVNQERVLRARAWYYTHVFADPVDPDTVYVLNAPMMRSIDGGKTFERAATPHGDNHALWINPADPAILINGNDGGANVSYNGGRTWSTQDNQPTAQFYRVITDNQFPYRVYGGQQDNSSVSIASRTIYRGGIGRDAWFEAGGCESAYSAFDPDAPRYVYSGCYQGLIGELDTVTGHERSIMAYEFLGLGATPKDLPYRFNWNAPIVASPHDSTVIYHAANKLLKTTDRGNTWEEISPDLTRNDETKQGPGGGPITNEGAGGENYGTLLYVVESPHEAGTIWAGSDDGLVHLTRDGGADWQDVTPPGLPEAMINTIEVSPHDPAKAYLAVTRYKFGDFTPRIYRTTDYGANWKLLVDGIAPEAFVRVVREDPVRPGLLYAGTETGFYVSFDDGALWQALQGNLPVVPITDLTVHGDDLVAATQGRAFWILDELSPLREMSAAVQTEPLHLFAPEPAYRVGGGRGGDTVGTNPYRGAVLYYWLATDLPEDDELKLEILDATGSVVRSYSSEPPKDEEEKGVESSTGGSGDDKVEPLPGKKGLNRWNWDLRGEPIARVPKLLALGGLGSYRRAPGSYVVRVTLGDTVVERPLEVVHDPRSSLAPADFAAQQATLAEIAGAADDLRRSVNRVREVKRQVEALAGRAKALDEGGEIAAATEELTAAMTEWEDGVVQSRQETFQDVINFPNRLDAELLSLMQTVDDAEPPLTDGAARRWRDLEPRVAAARADRDELLGARLEAWLAVIAAHDVPAVVVPE
jgi:photosystem II stability/assembly factor-like uncharacterized protein